MRIRLGLFVAALLTTFVIGIPPALAWGKFGHLTVCELAYRNFTPTTRATIADLLQSRSGGIKVKGRGRLPDRWYTAYNIGCLEEDEMPRRHAEDHFINVARNVPAIESATCPRDGDCILSGIDRDLAILRDPSRPREERVFSLMALGHWLGDIHQPLHVSFADDRGGNGIEAKLTGKCGIASVRPGKLHAVWDNCLLEAGLFERVRQRGDFKKNWSKNTITYRAVDTLQANTSLAEERAMVGGDPRAWAQESYQITLEPAVLYCVKVGGSCNYSATQPVLANYRGPKREQPISQAYLARYAPVAQDRVTRAGYRLAHLINSALDPAYTGAVRNRTQPS